MAFRHPIMQMLGVLGLVILFGSDARAELGALAHYRGDWMVCGNREHLVATRWQDGDDTLELRYAYRTSTCPRWTRESWKMQYDREANTYVASIEGTSKRSATGRWDEEANAMLWTFWIPDASDDSGEGQRVARKVKHEFEEGLVKLTTTLVHANGRESKQRPMVWNVLVPYSD